VRTLRAQTHTSWDKLEKQTTELGIRAAIFVLGDEDDDSAPRIGRYRFPPNLRVSPHTHEADYVEIILEGSQQVAGRWYYPGDIRIVKAGTVYGPLISGNDGVTALIMFRHKQSGPIPPRGDGKVEMELVAAT
jgi:hypothetical protein